MEVGPSPNYTMTTGLLHTIAPNSPSHFEASQSVKVVVRRRRLRTLPRVRRLSSVIALHTSTHWTSFFTRHLCPLQIVCKHTRRSVNSPLETWSKGPAFERHIWPMSFDDGSATLMVRPLQNGQQFVWFLFDFWNMSYAAFSYSAGAIGAPFAASYKRSLSAAAAKRTSDTCVVQPK